MMLIQDSSPSYLQHELLTSKDKIILNDLVNWFTKAFFITADSDDL